MVAKGIQGVCKLKSQAQLVPKKKKKTKKKRRGMYIAQQKA